MTYRFSDKALAELQKLPKEIQRRVVEKLDFIFLNDLLLSNSRPLSGEYDQCLRIRIGDYRAIFHIPKHGDGAVVIKVAHRKNVYKI